MDYTIIQLDYVSPIKITVILLKCQVINYNKIMN